MAATVSVSANQGSQIATVTGSALTDQFDPVLALASDILLNPSFPEKEIGLYKARARAGLEEQRSDPDFLQAGAVLEGRSTAATIRRRAWA